VKIVCTTFADLAARTKAEKSAAWSAFAASLAKPKQYATKEACPLISLSSYGDVPSEKGTLRHAGNVLKVYAVEADYDAGDVSIEEAAMRLAAHNVEAVLHTTGRHTPQKPRWRVFAPLSKPCAPAERATHVARLNAALGGILAPESFTLSQSFYFGRVNGAPYSSQRVRGMPIDLVSGLEGATPQAPPAERPRDADEELVEAIRSGTNFHNAARDLAARWTARGMGRAAILAALEGLMRQAEPAKGSERRHWQKRLRELPGLVESALAKFAPIELDLAANNFHNFHTSRFHEKNAGAEITDLPALPDMPRPIGREAFTGLLGDWVSLWTDKTEASPSSILVQTLCALSPVPDMARIYTGNATPEGPAFLLLVLGASARSRKGTGGSIALDLLRRAFPVFVEGTQPELEGGLALGAPSRVLNSLSSGEGLIAALRDDAVNRKGDLVPGVQDKRLLVVLAEFGQLLRTIAREGNTLQDVLRQAFDQGALDVVTRHEPLRAARSHVACLAHCTVEELSELAPDVALVNGLFNRWLYTYVEREKIVSNPSQPPENEREALARQAREALEPYTWASRDSPVVFEIAPGTTSRWLELDLHYKRGRPTPQECSLTARQPTLAKRLALLYAVLDRAKAIEVRHLDAAHAVVEHAEQAALHAFRERGGNSPVERIADFIREAGGDVVPRMLLWRFLGHRTPVAHLDRALANLITAGKIECVKAPRFGAGRTARGYRWQGGL
jgi:hypothetical protein